MSTNSNHKNSCISYWWHSTSFCSTPTGKKTQLPDLPIPLNCNKIIQKLSFSLRGASVEEVSKIWPSCGWLPWVGPWQLSGRSENDWRVWAGTDLYIATVKRKADIVFCQQCNTVQCLSTEKQICKPLSLSRHDRNMFMFMFMDRWWRPLWVWTHCQLRICNQTAATRF